MNQLYRLLFMLAIPIASAQSESQERASVAPRPSRVIASFSDAHQLSLILSPELRSSRLDREKARLRVDRGGRLANPEVELEWVDDGIGNGEGEGGYGVAIEQKVPFNSRLRWGKSVREQKLRVAQAQVLEARRQLAYDVETVLIDVEVIRLAMKRLQALEAVNAEIVGFIATQIVRGEASNLDQAHARITGQLLSQTLRDAEREERRYVLELKKLLGLGWQDPLEIKLTLKAPTKRPRDTKLILSKRPDYLLAGYGVAAADGVVELERSQRWDDVGVRVFVERESSVDEPLGLQENTMVGLGLSMALPIWKQSQESIGVAEIDARKADQGLKRLGYRIRMDVLGAQKERERSFGRLKEARVDLLALAQKNFEQLRRAYEQGQVGLLQVQQAQKQVLEVEKVGLESLKTYLHADARVRFEACSYEDLEDDVEELSTGDEK